MNIKIKVILGLFFMMLVGCSNHRLSEPMTVLEQNDLAVAELTSLGIEAEKTEKGVTIYLPPNINFEENKSDISLNARSKIAEISGELNKDYLVGRSIEVAGHANSNGDSETNQEISKRRAQAAAEELVFSKVLLSRIKVSWHGEEVPRFPEFDDEGKVIPESKELNRRVEFIVLNPGR